MNIDIDLTLGEIEELLEALKISSSMLRRNHDDLIEKLAVAKGMLQRMLYDDGNN